MSEEMEVCPMCDGSGTMALECCNGHKCSCGGQPVPMMCAACNGCGVVQNNETAMMNMRAFNNAALENKITHWGMKL